MVSRLKPVVVALVVVCTTLGIVGCFPVVYVANQNDGTLSQFRVDDQGRLVPLSGTVPGGLAPLGVAVSADRRFLYVTPWTQNQVRRFAITPGGGLVAKPPPVAAGAAPGQIAVTRDRRFLYVANIADETVSQYRVGAEGALTAAGPTARLPGPALDIAITPDSKSAYVTGPGRVSQFDVGNDGVLIPKQVAAITVPASASGIVVSRDGRSGYVASSTSNTISQFDVEADGTLMAKSPATVPGGGNPQDLVVSPDGKNLYASNPIPEAFPDPNPEPPSPGSVSQFSIGADGRLAAKSPLTVGAGINPLLLAMSRDSKSLYVTNQDDDTVSQYDVDPSGALSPKSPPTVRTGHAPTGIAFVNR